MQDAERADYTLEGAVTAFVSAANFVVQGEPVNALQASFTTGSLADIANGRRVRIKAFAGPGRVDAFSIAVLP